MVLVKKKSEREEKLDEEELVDEENEGIKEEKPPQGSIAS